MSKHTIYYILTDCGDGSATSNFYADKETADLANEVNELYSQLYGGFTEGEAHTLEIELNDDGSISISKYNTQSKEELLQRLEELNAK